MEDEERGQQWSTEIRLRHFQVNNLISPELVEAGRNTVRASIKPALQQVSSGAHRKICLDTATSNSFLDRYTPSYPTLLTSIALQHFVLDRHDFKIEQTWQPILHSIAEVPYAPYVILIIATEIPITEILLIPVALLPIRVNAG
ncbi:hypothetical protein GYMLUDRAFT_62245 [Collybiopsis luxurians FD-317 M1]|uniref:Uncharacterized protein n=1 Tax=Collybiopsis luxurians FD-317 M1 TaxID=944289 RepID=A0A0D0CLD6_9AGAR|nr:hypothetical protein GYMLUDRAFT_62245 [Collybiopsis luxurians FD-317 M1]